MGSTGSGYWITCQIASTAAATGPHSGLYPSGSIVFSHTHRRVISPAASACCGVRGRAATRSKKSWSAVSRISRVVLAFIILSFGSAGEPGGRCGSGLVSLPIQIVEPASLPLVIARCGWILFRDLGRYSVI